MARILYQLASNRPLGDEPESGRRTDQQGENFEILFQSTLRAPATTVTNEEVVIPCARLYV
jgi:hypothetical protein